jgi:hypothetical protein
VVESVTADSCWAKAPAPQDRRLASAIWTARPNGRLSALRVSPGLSYFRGRPEVMQTHNPSDDEPEVVDVRLGRHWGDVFRAYNRNPRISRGFEWAGEDSNLRPTDYESAALTN